MFPWGRLTRCLRNHGMVPCRYDSLGAVCNDWRFGGE